MTPTDWDKYKSLGGSYVHFQPFLYSLENSQPFVKFGQTDRWQIDPLRIDDAATRTHPQGLADWGKSGLGRNGRGEIVDILIWNKAASPDSVQIRDVSRARILLIVRVSDIIEALHTLILPNVVRTVRTRRGLATPSVDCFK